MIIRNNIPIYSICWLSHCEGGSIGTFYEPETKDELAALCRRLYAEGKPFDLIGHTSNTYYMPDYHVDTMVSTRKVVGMRVQADCIVCDCGVSVRSLSRKMVALGVKGFEGLIDLPGTVSASVYGNATCYGCSINQLLESFEILLTNGDITMLTAEDLRLSTRSSALKRGELGG